MRSLLKRLALVVAGTLFSLILCEGLLRVATGSDFPQSETLFDGRLIYDPVLSWRNVPGVQSGRSMQDGRWGEMMIPVNTMGFRGPEISREKPEGKTRIVCLGDSGTFGVLAFPDDSTPGGNAFFGIPTYPEFLQQRLRHEGFDDVEVINAGVVGYSTSMGLRQLILQILDLDPDIITVRFSANDSQLSWAPAKRAIEPSNALAEPVNDFETPGRRI